ncbi:MAG: hypothetical protein WC247_14640 [Porticoccaceae bacterium]
MSDKDFRRFDPIVPERDGPLPQGTSGKASFVADEGRRETAKGRGKSAAGRAGKPWLLYLCLVALVGLAVFSWYQSRVLADLSTRFSQLSARIESTDESLNQSGTTLSLKIREQEEKLAEHWTEIRKLWGISYDTNRKAIADNTKAIDGFKTSIANIQAGLKKTETSLAAIQQSVATASKQAEESSKGVAAIRNSTLGAAAQVDELRDKVNKMSESLATTNTTVNQLRTDLTRRVGENEQAIRAMDSYRSQINQQLNQLRQQLGGAP